MAPKRQFTSTWWACQGYSLYEATPSGVSRAEELIMTEHPRVYCGFHVKAVHMRGLPEKWQEWLPNEKTIKHASQLPCVTTKEERAGIPKCENCWTKPYLCYSRSICLFGCPWGIFRYTFWALRVYWTTLLPSCYAYGPLVYWLALSSFSVHFWYCPNGKKENVNDGISSSE